MEKVNLLGQPFRESTQYVALVKKAEEARRDYDLQYNGCAACQAALKRAREAAYQVALLGNEEWKAHWAKRPSKRRH